MIKKTKSDIVLKDENLGGILMGLVSKIFGSYSEKEVKRVMPIVNKINELETEISSLTDEELTNKTKEFKEEL